MEAFWTGFTCSAQDLAFKAGRTGGLEGVNKISYLEAAEQGFPNWLGALKRISSDSSVLWDHKRPTILCALGETQT